jgi:hypothetical protein
MVQIGIAFGMIERKASPNAVIELHYRGKEDKCQDENSLPSILGPLRKPLDVLSANFEGPTRHFRALDF